MDDVPRKRWASLGYQRNCLLACLGAGGRFGPSIDVAAPAGVHAAFRDYVARVTEAWAGATVPVHLGLLAAGRLLTGDLTGADTILDLLPDTPSVTDHGAGYCNRLPIVALITALPAPAWLDRDRSWCAESADVAAVRA